MSSNERLPRAILPKANKSRISEPILDAMAEQGDGISSKSIRNSTQIRSNIRSACLACRQRRSKCTGGSPCNRCQTLGTDCTYEEGQDRRTRAIRERGKEELELHKKVLDGLFKAIRNGDDKSLMALVQQNASLHDMAALIDGDSLSEDGQQESLYDGIPSSNTSESLRIKEHGSSAQSKHEDSSDHETLNRLQSTLEQDLATGRYVISDETGSTDSRQWSTPSASDQATVIPDGQDSSFRHVFAPHHNPESPVLDQLSRFSMQFRETGVHMIRQGFPAEAVLGYSNVHCDLLFRSRLETDTFNIYTWASAVVNGFPDLDIFFRLGWLVFLVRFMRWSVDMTESNFKSLPELMKPTSLQISMSHALFIDLAPLPQLRDALIHKPRDYCAAFQLSGISISWNRPLEEAVFHDPDTGSMTVTRAFEEHVSDPNQFLFGRSILSVFPELTGQLRTISDDFIPATTLLLSTNDAMSTVTSFS